MNTKTTQKINELWFSWSFKRAIFPSVWSYKSRTVTISNSYRIQYLLNKMIMYCYSPLELKLKTWLKFIKTRCSCFSFTFIVFKKRWQSCHVHAFYRYVVPNPMLENTIEVIIYSERIMTGAQKSLNICPTYCGANGPFIVL